MSNYPVTMYKASFGKYSLGISEVEVVRVTSKMVFFMRESRNYCDDYEVRENKECSTHSYHESFEEAQDVMTQVVEDRIAKYEARLKALYKERSALSGAASANEYKEALEVKS